MKEKYISPEIKIVYFDSEDIMKLSANLGDTLTDINTVEGLGLYS